MEDGLVVYEISDSTNPFEVSQVETTGNAKSVELGPGYAYVLSDELDIINIETPESAALVHTVDIPGSTKDISSWNNYVYVADGSMIIIDVSSPESASIISSTGIVGKDIRQIAVSNGFAAVYGDWVDDSWLTFFDVDPPEVPLKLASEPTNHTMNGGFVASGNYLYALDSNWSGSLLHIYQLDPPDLNPVGLLDLPPKANGLLISNGYAYTAADGLKIIDVDPPESAHVEVSYDWPFIGGPTRIAGSFAYIAAGTSDCIQLTLIRWNQPM